MKTLTIGLVFAAVTAVPAWSQTREEFLAAFTPGARGPVGFEELEPNGDRRVIHLTGRWPAADPATFVAARIPRLTPHQLKVTRTEWEVYGESDGEHKMNATVLEAHSGDVRLGCFSVSVLSEMGGTEPGDIREVRFGIRPELPNWQALIAQDRLSLAQAREIMGDHWGRHPMAEGKQMPDPVLVLRRETPYLRWVMGPLEIDAVTGAWISHGKTSF